MFEDESCNRSNLRYAKRKPRQQIIAAGAFAHHIKELDRLEVSCVDYEGFSACSS